MAILERPLLRQRIRATDPQLIGSKILTARKEADLSHDGLGALLGVFVQRPGRKSRSVSRSHLIKLERGQHRPRPEMLERLAVVLERPVEWFLSEEVSDQAPLREDEDAA